jgi:flagellar capping protein FliD
MKNQQKNVQESINRLTKLIESLKKDENHNPETLKKHYSDLAEYQKEFSRLIKLEWEETYERLDYGDDR